MTNQPNTTIHPILAVPWIEAGEPAAASAPEPVITAPEPVEGVEPTKPAARRDIPLPHALTLAAIISLAVVSLLAASLDWISTTAFLYMSFGFLFAAAITVVAWPRQHTNSAKTFHTWSSEPREPFVYPPCSPTRHTITGRGDHVA